MNQTIEISAKDSDGTAVRLTAKIKAHAYILTKDEQKSFKEDLESTLMQVLRNFKYKDREIKLK